MNKIYKVIWSKVKNQYVVVSELAHSSGKQSRTSRNSIRSRIAALVVCGAIAAFGVLPMNSASAAVNVKAGDGIEVDQGWNTTISIKLVKDENEKLESGLTFDTNGGLKVDTGSGLIIKDNKVVIDLASGKGLTFDGNSLALDVKNDSGLTTDDQNGLKVKTGAGLKIDGQGQVALNVNTNNNSGLTFDEKNNELKVNTGSALEVNNNQVNVKLAETNAGLSTEGGLHVDTGDGLTTTNIAGEYTGLSVKTADNSLIVNQDGLKVNIDENSGLDTTTDGLAVKLAETNSGLATNGGLHIDAGNGLSTETGELAVKLDGKSLSADGNGLKVNVKENSGLDTTDGLAVKLAKTDSGLTATSEGLKVNVKANSGLTADADGLGINLDSKTLSVGQTGQLAVKLAESNSGLDATNGLAVNLAEKSGLDATDGLKVKVKTDSGLIVEDDGALSIDKDAFSTGSTNVKAGTNIDVADDGTVSLEPNVTLDANAEDGNKIDLSGTNGTISAVNSKSSVDGPSGEWYENKTTTTNKITNTFDFSDGGKFVTEKNENTVVKGPGNLVTLYGKDITTKNTTEFNEKGATFTKEENISESWKKPITNISSTNIDGGTITTDTVKGLSNTTWNAENAKNSNKAATEAQLYTVAGDIDALEGEVNKVGQGWTATDSKGRKIQVTPNNNTLQFNGDKNIDVTADKGAINVKLNPVVTLNGDKPDGDGIVLNGESGSIHAVNTQAIGDGFFGNKIDLNKFDFDNDGAKFVTVKTKFGTAVKDGIEVHTTEFNENGATFTKTSITEDNMKLNNSSTNIDGGVVTTDKVQGLDNTKWDDGLANAVDKSKRLQGMAATQGQLRDVDIKVNKNTQAIEENADDIGALKGEVDKVGQGWTVSDGNSGTKDFNVKPGETLKFNGDKNIDVTAADGAVNVGLKPVVTLGGDTEDSNKVVLDGENGTISVTNEHTTKGPAQTITNEFKFNNEGATFTNTTKHGNGNGYGNAITSSTNIDGGTITISSDARGKDKVVINGTTGEMSGLSNTDWDPQKASSYETSDKAATEAQLQKATGAISKDLNTLSDFAVKYDKNTDETVNKNSITLAGGESGTQIHNVKAGEAGTDAVNVSQLIGKTGDLQYNDNPYDNYKSIVKNNDNLTTAVGKLDDAIQKTSETANKGWTANAGNKDIDVKPGDTLQFKGDNNITVTANDRNDSINVELNPVVTLDGTKYDGDGIVLNGYDGTISAVNTDKNILGNKTTTNTFKFDNGGKFVTKKVEDNTNWVGEGTVTTTINTSQFDENGATFINNKKEETSQWKMGRFGPYLSHDEKTENSSTNIDGGTIKISSDARKDGKDIVIDGTAGEMSGLSNTTWDAQNPNAYANSDKAATEAQLQKATAASKTTVSAGDNIKVDSTQNNDGHIDYKVSLKDNITLDGTAGHINFNPDSETSMISIKNTAGNPVFNVANNGTVSSDGDVIAYADGDKDNSNKKYSLSEVSKYAVRYDDNNGVVNTGKITLAGPNGTTIANVAAGVSDTDAVNVKQLKAVEATATKGWVATDSKNGEITVTPGDELKFNGDNKNIDVTVTDGAVNVKLKDNIALDGEAGHINFNPDNENSMISIKDTTGNAVFNVAQDGTVSSAGNVTAVGDVTAGGGAYSLTEVSKFAVRYNENDDGTVNTGKITLAGEKGTTIENVAAGVSDTDAVNVSQLKAVEATASAGWTAKAGNDTITVKPNQTLNFEGDGNITVSATSGTSSELKFGLKDTVVLGDAVPTEEGGSAASLVLSSDGSYVPPTATDDDKSETGIIGSHGGGFILYSTNSAGNPMFGVTADGVVHAKDVISYYDDDNNPTTPSNIKYSLNDVGDIVTQIAHGKFTSGTNATGMEYTLISDFTGEIDKENPFVAVDEKGNPTERTIGLAVRQDGAVVVGAVVNGQGVMSNESGIRINDANTETGGGGKDTITGLANTEWKPPTSAQSMISLYDTDTDDAANKAKIEASKAATQGQLNAMYNYTVSYALKDNGDPNYDIVNLAGTEYDKTTHKNGTLVTNVAYATTNKNDTNYDGSAAVNVDVLNNAIAGVEAGTSADIGNLDYGNVTGTDIDKGQDVTTAIGKVNNKVDNLDDKVGDLVYSKFENDTTPIQDGDSVTEAIGKLNNSINGVTQDVVSNSISGGHVDTETGDIVLEKGNGSTVTVGTLTDSVIDSAELKDGTLTITSKDKYSKEETSSVKVEGIASTEVVGAKNKEDLATAYKDADKDGNATTEYITDSETMVDADVALDHAIQDVASTSYANDMALSNRIDNVEKRLGDVEERIDKVGAMSAAIANLRTMGYDPEAPTEIAVGVGQYKSETGLAIGIFHYPNQDFMLSASISTSGDEVMGGIGATWRIGRKTAAEKAKDEEKRILAKAEEIKQAAKRAEVKAQADRHAKLLAEREAKGEPIRPIEKQVEQAQEQA